ncbi:hypothetical protein ABEW02_08790 [Bacillus safensis]|uniref:hypothetical protein n=1 Tax=Bacillus safensis TaxID=561879 RepID=UPI000C793B90|nr:hypothetical protein [Bacillus safensis]PLT36885.1 hypothetical protein CUU65_16365 [Bacillus safensis]
MKITNKVLSLLLIFSLFVGVTGFIPQAKAVGQDDEAYQEDSSVIIEEDNESDAYEELEELLGINEDAETISSSNNDPVITAFMNKDMGGGNGYPAGGGGIGKVRPTPKPKPTPKPTLPARGFKTGAEGEKYLNAHVNGNGHKTFKNVKVYDKKKKKYVFEKRIIDAYVSKKGVAHESKVGYTSLSNFVRKQIDKDARLRSEGRVKGVKWHFFKSAKTGKIGITKNLKEYLEKKKIPYQIHK